MNITMMLSITSLFYIFILIILFFTKSNLKNKETKLYSILLVSVFLGILLELSMRITCILFPGISIMDNIISKVFLFYTLFWFSLITIYNFIISFSDKKYYVFKKAIIIFNIVADFLIMIFPINFFYKPGNNYYSYTYGLAVNFLYGCITFIIITNIIFLVMKRSKVFKNKKYYPIIICIVLILIATIIQNRYPDILLNIFIQALTTFIMYHTIENPDVQMINELYKNKMLVEKTYEDKSNFLFKMTQEVKKPITNMNNIMESLKMSDEKSELKQGIKLLEANGRQLDFVVNDVLDITTLDAKNIKIMNSRYNVYTLFNDIEKRMEEYATDEVEFRFDIDQNIPYLYGDAIKLKQIIMSILLNSVKKTKTGFIELSVNAIMKYDVCRLIIEIEDSGVGMSIDKINELMVTTSELNIEEINNLEKLDLNLDLCQKSIKLLGGNLMIRSEVGKGTEVIVTIDQKIYESESNDKTIEKYQNMLFNSSKVLIVGENEEEIERIKKYIEDKSIIVSTSLYANDCIDKVRSGKTYNLILMSDEMSTKSGLTTLRELKEIERFNIPVVVMLEENKEKIKDHYIKDGFKDYLLKSNLEDEVKRIINKYC